MPCRQGFARDLAVSVGLQRTSASCGPEPPLSSGDLDSPFEPSLGIVSLLLKTPKGTHLFFHYKISTCTL